MLQDSVAEVARRLDAATSELLELPDAELAAAVAPPAPGLPPGSSFSPTFGGDTAGSGDSEEGFAARGALLRAYHLALLTADAAADEGVRGGLDRLLQARLVRMLPACPRSPCGALLHTR